MTRFKKGVSGNPSGKKTGTLNHATRLRKQIEQSGDELITVLLDVAKSGDVTALRLALDRVVPALKPVSEPIVYELDVSLSLSEQAAQVMQAVAGGTLSHEVGKVLIDSIAAQVKISEYTELEARLSALEGGTQ